MSARSCAQLGYDYQNGLLKRVRDAQGSTVFWEAVSTDAWGHLQNEAFGNGVASYTEYDAANGWLFKREAGVGGGSGLVDAQVTWDVNGNFTTRQDLRRNLTETFAYDALNRLDYSQRNGVTNLDVTLDAIGNVTYRSDVGAYSYHATRRRAVVTAGPNSYGYDANGNMTSRNGGALGYTSYNQPATIQAGSASSSFAYGAWRNRYRQVAVSGGVTETTLYVAGLLERVSTGGVTEWRHRIAATPGTVAIYTRRSAGPAQDTYYLHRDHLGSVELISTTAGAVRARLSFAAYGERRDTDWAGPVSAADLATLGATTREGFTGQVQLDGLGLIGFPGRVYDPAVGRFLSRDPLIDGRAASQGANGYAYVWNNPLSLTDPSGYQVAEEDPLTPTLTDAVGILVEASRLYAPRPTRAADPSLGGGGNVGGGGGAPPSEPGERGAAVTLEDGLETVTVTAPHWRAPPPPVIAVVALSSSRLPQGDLPPCSSIKGPSIDFVSQLGAYGSAGIRVNLLGLRIGLHGELNLFSYNTPASGRTYWSRGIEGSIQVGRVRGGVSWEQRSYDGGFSFESHPTNFLVGDLIGSTEGAAFEVSPPQAGAGFTASVDDPGALLPAGDTPICR